MFHHILALLDSQCGLVWMLVGLLLPRDFWGVTPKPGAVESGLTAK